MILFNYSTEIISIIQLLIGWIALFFLERRYGKSGIFVYIVVSVIVSNIQVLKFALFAYSADPIALGTIPFASTLLATDMLTEFYSVDDAKKSVNIGFFGFALFSALMVLHVAIPAVPEKILLERNLVDGHSAMSALFVPLPSLFLASIIAYFISERVDIRVYAFFKTATRGRHLWFRCMAAATVSTILDTLVFSILAWKVLSLHSLEWKTIFYSYILGGFWPRIVIAASGLPVLYLLKRNYSATN